MSPDVSIVMPAFRAAATIGAAVSGVLTQTVGAIELVVVDDGSDDATADIVSAHADPRVRLIRQDNQGVAVARNIGIEAANAELIAFCDADDILLPRHVEAMLCLNAPRTIVTANAYWLFPGGIDRRKLRHRGRFPAGPEQRQAILESNFVSTMSLFPKAVFRDIGPFDPDLRRAEDWDFWLRAILGGTTVVHQPVPHALYRWSGAGLSSERGEMDRAADVVLQRAAARADLRPGERAYLRARLAGPGPRVTLRTAEEALRDGRYRAAAAAYRDTSALVPSERTVVWMARLINVFPGVTGPVLRARQRRREGRLGWDATMVR